MPTDSGYCRTQRLDTQPPDRPIQQRLPPQSEQSFVLPAHPLALASGQDHSGNVHAVPHLPQERPLFRRAAIL